MCTASSNAAGATLGSSERTNAACAQSRELVLPDPDDCSRYIWCAGGRGLRKSCPRGQFYSPIIGLCVYGDPALLCPRKRKPDVSLKITNQNDLIGGTTSLLSRG